MTKIDVDTLPTWDAAYYLGTPSLQAEYLSLVMEDGDEAEIAHALAAIARARVKETREDDRADAIASRASDAVTISKALSLVKALGLKLNVQPANAS